MAAISSYPVSATLNHLAPLRTPRPRVAPPNPSIAKPSSQEITRAMQIVDRTSWIQTLQPLMPHTMRKAHGLHPGGREPEMTLKALFVSLLLLAMMERPLLIRDAHRLLAFGLDSASRKHLGLDPKRVVTERMVSRTFSLVAAALNPSVYAESNATLFDAANVKILLGLSDDEELDPYEHALFIDTQMIENAKRLDDFIRNGLRATHPKNSDNEGDYHLDGSYISSWERAKTTRRKVTRTDKFGVTTKRPARPHEMSDPDATWWSKKNDGPIAKKGRLVGTNDSGLGYMVSAVTWSEKDCGPGVRGADIPYLIDHLSVKTARTTEWKEGARVLEKMISHHETEDAAAGKSDRLRGDILADRGYTRVSQWQSAMHDLGLTPHFALAAEQRGNTQTLSSGALIIDGIPYSPGIPLHLRQSFSPPAFATREDRAWDAAYYLQRKPYRLRVNNNRRKDDGSLNLYCPASNQAKASIACSNKPPASKEKSRGSKSVQLSRSLQLNRFLPSAHRQRSLFHLAMHLSGNPTFLELQNTSGPFIAAR